MISRILFSFFLAAVIGSFNASAVAVYLNQSQSATTAGQTLDIGVIVDPQGASVAGVYSNIMFNNSLLNINSITEGNLLKQDGASTIFNSGVIDGPSGRVDNIYGSILGPYNITNRGTFITINVKALNNINTAELNLDNFKVVGSNGDQVYPAPTSTPANPSQLNNAAYSGEISGFTSGENYTNIESTERYDLNIYRDVTTSYMFKKTTNPVVFVNITGNTNSVEITASVEILKGTSTLVKSTPPGNVYKNVNIWVGTFGYAIPENIKHAEIIFKVPVEWIRANNFDPDSIEMIRYDNGWQSLPSRKIGVDKDDILYEASTTGFSMFAITGKNPSGKTDQLLYNSGTASNNDPQAEQQAANDTSGTTPILPEKERDYYKYPIFTVSGILAILILVYKIRIFKKK